MWKKSDDLMEKKTARIVLFEDAMRSLLQLMTSGEVISMEMTPEDMECMYQSVTTQLCRSCVRFRLCFGEEAQDTLAQMKELLSKIQAPDDIYFQFSNRLQDKCIYYSDFQNQIYWICRMILQSKYWKQQCMELRGLMRGQMESQLQLMKEYERTLQWGRRITGLKKKKLKYSLLRRGIYFYEGEEYEEEDGKNRVDLILAPFGGPKKGMVASKVLSSIYGYTLLSDREDLWLRRGKNCLSFSRQGRFHAVFGYCRINKLGETVCGDTFSYLNYGRKRVILLLSDGMGTGKTALEDSQRLIEAFEDMMEAGIEETCALEILHHILMTQQKTMYSTMDVCVLSLMSGKLKLLKAGGVSTFIKHNTSVERITIENLPIGSPKEQRFDVVERLIEDGDTIIMVSDGLLEFECMPEMPFRMEALISGIKTNNAQSFAEQLMEAVPVSIDGHDDDRSILVASVWDRSA